MKNVREWFLKQSLVMRAVIIVVIVGIVWFGFLKLRNPAQKPQYQTAQVQRDTLIVSVSASGQVSAVNNSNVTTQATGVVAKVYVKDGDKVQIGQKLAEIDLDLLGRQKNAQAYSALQSAQNALSAAKATAYSLQSDMFTNWKTYLDLATNSTYQNSDGSPNNTNRALAQFHIAQDDWLATEAKYKNQQAVISQTQTAVNAAFLSYQQSSPVIYASISGIVSGFSLQPGAVIVSQQSSTSTQTATGTKIANITTNASPTVTINLTEIDAPSVKVGNKATVTFDSFPDKTYTGKVISIDTVGAVTSGVTTYPTVIKLDLQNPSILPNMSAQATIITQTKNDVLLVPTAAVQTQNGQSTVQVMKNGKVSTITVETGLASDSQIEITSGLSEGDVVVTGTTTPLTTTRSTGQTQSPFSPFGGGLRGGGGGGARFGR